MMKKPANLHRFRKAARFGALLLCLEWTPLAVPAFASFEESLTGGRAAGVDGAMTASADDVFSLYYNPAGAMRVKRPEVGFYFGDLYPGLSDNSTITRSYLGFIYPLKNQALGISYTRLSLKGLYAENTVGLTYSRTLRDTLSVGGTLKYYNKWVGTDFDANNATDDSGNILPGVRDPVFSGGESAGGMGGDLGLMWGLDRGWSLGAMVENLYETDVSLRKDGSDRVPRAWKFGAAREWGDGWQGMFDLWYGRFITEELRVRGGVEKWWKSGFGLRAGGGIGARENQQITMGGSYRWSALELDYGFMMPIGTLEGSDGSHHLSFIWRWGSEPQNNVIREEQAASDAPTDESLKDIMDATAARGTTGAARGRRSSRCTRARCCAGAGQSRADSGAGRSRRDAAKNRQSPREPRHLRYQIAMRFYLPPIRR